MFYFYLFLCLMIGSALFDIFVRKFVMFPIALGSAVAIVVYIINMPEYVIWGTFILVTLGLLLLRGRFKVEKKKKRR